MSDTLRFFTHLDGQRLTICHHCLTPKERNSQHPRNEVWEYNSHGWLSIPWCQRCYKSIPVYLDKTILDKTPVPEEQVTAIELLKIAEALDTLNRRVAKLTQRVLKLTAQVLGQPSEKT